MPRRNRPTLASLAMLLVLSIPILVACDLKPTPVPPPLQPATPALVSDPAARGDMVIIGMRQDPDSLYALISSMPVQRTVEHAIKEPWVHSLNYTYTANPRYLVGDLPTVDNGGAVVNEVQAFIDNTGVITTSPTGTPITTQQLVVRFRMQPGLKWEDGQPLTARDVVFGHRVGCDPGSGAIRITLCNNIQAVTALDETTWTVTYRPGPEHFDALYYTNINGQNLVLPQHELGESVPAALQSDPRVTEHPMGWGPYKLEEGGWKKGQSITLVKNEHYAGAARRLPQISTAVFQIIPDANRLWAALYAGEIDVSTSDALSPDLLRTIEQAEQDGKLRAFFIPSTTLEHIAFNFNRPGDLAQFSLLADPALRHAMAYGSNRQGYIDALAAGKTTLMHSWIPETSWAYAGEEQLALYPYDVNRAATLLEQAGYIDSDGDGIREKNGERLSFSLRTSAGMPLRERLTQLFQADMRAIGIEIKIELLPASVWFDSESGLGRRDFEIGAFAWVAEPDHDGAVLYACDQIPGPENNWEGQNYVGWCSEAANVAITRATQSLSLEERQEAYRLHQIEFTRDLPSLPLFSRLTINGASLRLHKFAPNVTAPETWNIGEWALTGR